MESGRMKNLVTIASQILVAVIITVVIVLGISSLIEVNILKNRETQKLSQRGSLTADRIANSLAYPLWNLNQIGTEQVVDDELVAQEVSKIQVFDEHGQLYAGKIKNADGSISPVSATDNAATSGDEYTFNREITFRGNKIGSVKLEVSTAYLQSEINKLRMGIAVKLVLLVTVLSLVLLAAFRVLVGRRLSALKAWVEGPRTAISPPNFKYSGEINSLAESFGKMSVSLHKQNEVLENEQAELKELNKQLHEKIVQREEAEAALRESESRFRQLTENINEVLWMNAPDYSATLFISPTYEKVWGRTTASLYENPYSFLESVHPDDRVWVEKKIRGEREHGFSLEYRIERPDGSVRWIWDRGFPIKDASGHVFRIAGIAEDITDRKQAQEELRRYADEVRDLYNNAPCGYHSLDEKGFYVQINDTELEWLGYTREEVVGKLRFSDALPPQERPIFEERYKQFVATGSVRDIEYRLLSKDGSTRTVLLSATSSRDSEGKFLMSRATVYDIDARRRAETLVERSEEKFARAFRSSPVGLAVTRLNDGRFIEVNEAALSFLGYTEDELIGNTTVNLGMWPSLVDRASLLNEVRDVGSVRGKEIRFRTKQGTEVLCEYSAESIEVDGEPCVLSVLLDITERRHMEQELKVNAELLHLFVKHTPAAIAMFDTQMRYLQVSDRFLTDYHIEGQDIIGKCHYDVFPDIPQRWRDVHQRILKGAVERNDEDPYVEADGTPGWLQWESLPWRKADGEIGGLILFTQVITERKRAEQALRYSEERFARIFNLSPYRMGILRAADGVILDVNDCWVRETGYSRAEAVNRSIFELEEWLPEESLALMRRVLDERRPFQSLEGTIRTKSGAERFALSSIVLVDFDGEPCYLWAANDITERKHVEEEKRQLIHDLGERVKELTALHQTAKLLQDESISLPHLLQEIVALLPPAWQFPEVTAARIRFGDFEFMTKGFVVSLWSQQVEFSAGDTKGEIEVVYTEARPPQDIGPFVKEEASLINSLAEMISSALNRRYIQRALAESEEVFRTLAETVSAGIYIYRDSKFIYVNPTAESMSGYSRDELLKMSVLDLVHPSFRDDVRERVMKRALGWQTPARNEDKVLTKSGEERWMDVSAAGTKFRGEPAVIVTTFDVTSRKRAEEELQRSEERYRTLFDTSPDAVGVFDADMHLLMSNERAASLYGFTGANELIGKSLYDFIAPEDRERVRELIAEIQKTGKLAVFECTGLRRDNTRFDLETRATLIPNVDGGAPSVLTVKTDITQRKQAEKALKSSQDQLRALSAKAQSAREEEGTRIAREIHDELGGALTGLKWDLEGIDTSLKDENAKSTIADVRKQIKSMTGLIESTIDTVRRISSELRPGVLDDLGLVAAIEWQAQQFQKRTGLKVDWKTDLDNTEVSRDGATAVFRIFQEVLTNVLRHSRASNITVKLNEIDHHLELEVADDGRGITEDEQKNTTSLGLLGMKERALLVGGEVSIKGTTGKGTTVIVRIPLISAADSEDLA
jgi:PAS domain S-box-containing protein